MNFIADNQTLEDLNITGKYRPNAIFGLFNKVKTTGGEKLLLDMFAHPLTDAADINRRSRVFQYFQDTVPVFPFEKEMLAVVENYLGNNYGSGYLAVMMTLFKMRLQQSVTLAVQFSEVKNAQLQAIAMLDTCRAFLETIGNMEAAGEVLSQKIKAAKAVLADPRIAAIKADITHSLFTIIQQDHLLKNVLGEQMKTLLSLIYELDVYVAVGQVASAKKLCYAQALAKSKNVFKAAAIWHPGISNAVANPVSLYQQNNLVFLTGANMAGKSTLMKSIGINFYLAHMGFPVAAHGLQFSVKDGLYSSINMADSLQNGFSHFYAEVHRVKTVATAVSKAQSLLVIFDELFKGTNVKDAYDATLAVTTAFSKYGNCLFLVSTHITEVGAVLKQQCGNVQFLYLPALMDSGKPTYPYKVEQGISDDRHGMMIIQQEGILDILAAES
jgi:DNA mismatch repair ATPase MutS